MIPILAVLFQGVVFILAMWIPSWLTPDPTLQKMLFDIIPLIGFGQAPGLVEALLEPDGLFTFEGKVDQNHQIFKTCLH